MNEFRNHLVSYFNNSHFKSPREPLRETDQATHSRHQIDLMVQEVHRIVVAAEVNARMVYTPPPAIGGYFHEIDVFNDIFHLHRFNITPDQAVSFLDRTIGVYQSDRRKSVLRTFNPLWWLVRTFEWFSLVPFSLIGAAGFDAAKAEDSVFGRILKIIILLIPLISAFLTILYHIGLLDKL